MSILQRNNNISKETLWLVIILLVFRIPLLKSIEFFINPIPIWIIQICEVSMYLLLAILIFREKDHLADFFINKLAVVIFILSATIFRLIAPSFDSSIKWIVPIFWGIAATLIILLRKKGVNFEKIRADNYIWLFNGFAIGLFLSFILAIPRYLALEEQIQQSSHSIVYLFVFFLASFTAELVNTSVIEEFIFRGFLWGCLRKTGMADKWILVIQAGLFWVAHINYIDRGYSFWVALPVGGLALGLVAWQSKSIVTSMITHSVVNAMAYIIFDILGYLR